MSAWPSTHGILLHDLTNMYGASDFKGALSCFIIHVQSPHLPHCQVELTDHNLYFTFHKLLVYHHIKFVSQDPYSLDPSAAIVVDSHQSHRWWLIRCKRCASWLYFTFYRYSPWIFFRLLCWPDSLHIHPSIYCSPSVVPWQETFTIEWFTLFATLCPE